MLVRDGGALIELAFDDLRARGDDLVRAEGLQIGVEIRRVVAMRVLPVTLIASMSEAANLYSFFRSSIASTGRCAVMWQAKRFIMMSMAV